MQLGTLKALEFDRIVDAVCRFAQTPTGSARLARLHPLVDAQAVADALAATAEAARFLGDGQISLDAPVDLETALDALAVEGRALEPGQLLGLATFLASVGATCVAIRLARSAFPILRRLADSAASFDQEIADIRRKIDPSGEVADEASAELKALRDRLRKQRARLRGTLESYLRGKDTAKYLQQQIVTDRNGRFVLVVRAEHRTAIPGIVHGASGSGASLYLEPLSTVEINNDIVALEQEEAEEVRRILLALSDQFRRRAVDLQHSVAAATGLDELQARAQFSLMVDGVQPAIAADGRLELRAARHPLLIGAVRRTLDAEVDGGAQQGVAGSTAANEHAVLVPDPGARSLDPGTAPVPVDILVVPPTGVLVITGPNTGGKTVALKTAGLLSLMAQAGLLIPAAGGSQIPVFRSVFADIGDEQSIAANLSTFSAHIANVVSMDRSLALPSLVLLDEAGAGTDPNEGGALAMAIIDHFRRRGATVLATTHYDVLKTYASTTEGVVAAGFGFDPETFAPTYRLNYGSPGSSLALEIAARLGMPDTVIEQACAHRTAREAQLAAHLARIDKDVQALEHDRRLAARERETLAEAATKLQAREHELRNREETFRRRMDEKIEERLREARREIDAVVDAVKARAGRLIPTGQTGAARAEARSAIEAIGERLREGASRPEPAATPPAVVGRPAAAGDRVLVGGLGLEGIVQAIHDREAEVDVRGKRLRARLDELRVLAGPTASQPARVRVQIDLQPRDGATTELNVIGCNVDEALTRLEKFLDEALVTDTKTLRIIHGYGTGQLRRAVGEFLRTHPIVAGFHPAPENQGAGGATIVELKE